MNRFLSYIFLPMAFLAALLSCERRREVLPPEPVPEDPSQTVTAVLPYALTVTQGMPSKASLEGDRFVFESGDMLYVKHQEGGMTRMYGRLAFDHFADPSEKRHAVFTGELNCVGGFEPERDTPLSVTLVSSTDQVHSVSNMQVADERTYTGFASSMANAIRMYGDFVASGYYIDKSFVLYQRSAFLQFTLSFGTDVAAGASMDVVLSNGAEEAVRTAAGLRVSGQRQLRFVAAFPEGYDISGHKLSLSGENDYSKTFALIPRNPQLEGNKSYSVERSMVESSAFSIQAIEDGTVVRFGYSGAEDGIQYSLDNGMSWWDYAGEDIGLDAGENVRFRGLREDYSSARLFTSSGPCTVSGQLSSLLMQSGYAAYRSTVPADAFKQAFEGNTAITGGSLVLPDMPLGGGNCYEAMFRNCTGFTSCPLSSLPATELTTSCYQEMFAGCTSLTAAPALAATTLASACCESMFKGCTSLVSAPAQLLAEEVPPGAYRFMFEGCTQLTALPDMSGMQTVQSDNWSSGKSGDSNAKNVNGGCLKMFYGCKALTTLPDMSGLRTVEGYGMYEMFANCTGLTTVSEGFLSSVTDFRQGAFFGLFEGCSNLLSAGDFLPKPQSGEPYPMTKECYRQLFKNCTKLSSVPADLLPATTLAELCYTAMFEQCPALVTAPNLPAATLVSKCYEWMFEHCAALTTITCLATNSKNVDATKQWLQNAKNTSECTFYRMEGADWNTGVSGIPSSWTVQNYTP